MRTIRPLLKTTTGRPQTLESHQLSAIAERQLKHVHVWHTLHVLCLTKVMRSLCRPWWWPLRETYSCCESAQNIGQSHCRKPHFICNLLSVNQIIIYFISTTRQCVILIYSAHSTSTSVADIEDRLRSHCKFSAVSCIAVTVAAQNIFGGMYVVRVKLKSLSDTVLWGATFIWSFVHSRKFIRMCTKSGIF